MTEEILRQVLEKKRGERRREETAAKERKAAALSVPEVAEAHREYVYALHESLRYGGDERKRRAEKAYAEYTAALENAGFSERDFEPRTLCPICGDTGMHEGKLCSCVHDDLVRALGVACDLSPEGETLSDLARSALGSQAEKLKAMYARMSTYAEKFPDVNRTVIDIIRRLVLISSMLLTCVAALDKVAATQSVVEQRAAVLLHPHFEEEAAPLHFAVELLQPRVGRPLPVGRPRGGGGVITLVVGVGGDARKEIDAYAP